MVTGNQIAGRARGATRISSACVPDHNWQYTGLRQPCFIGAGDRTRSRGLQATGLRAPRSAKRLTRHVGLHSQTRCMIFPDTH